MFDAAFTGYNSAMWISGDEFRINTVVILSSSEYYSYKLLTMLIKINWF